MSASRSLKVLVENIGELMKNLLTDGQLRILALTTPCGASVVVFFASDERCSCGARLGTGVLLRRPGELPVSQQLRDMANMCFCVFVFHVFV